MTWDGQPMHRFGRDGEEPGMFGPGREVPPRTDGHSPFGWEPPAMPADPFGGMTAALVTQVELIREAIAAGLTEPQAMFYVACLVQVGMAIESGKFGPMPGTDSL